MNFIESHFIEIAFVIVFMSIINIVSDNKDNSESMKGSSAKTQVVCR